MSDTPLTLKANWGRGFKLPSFYALGNSIVGNPNLLPERSEGSEFGIDYQWSLNKVIGLSFFKTNYQNLVDFDTGPPPILVNRSAVRIEGVEFSLQTKPNKKLSGSAYISYIDSLILDSDDELKDRPDIRAGFSLFWQPKKKFDVNLDAYYVGDILSSSIPTGDKLLQSYTLVNLGGRWRTSKNLILSFSIDNIFNEQYEHAVGFFAPSRRLGISLVYKH